MFALLSGQRSTTPVGGKERSEGPRGSGRYRKKDNTAIACSLYVYAHNLATAEGCGGIWRGEHR